MGKDSKTDKMIWALTTFMFACFSISTTNSNWSSLSLAIITAIVLVINLSRKGFSGIRIDNFHKSIFLFAMYCLASSLWAIDSNDALEKGITILEILLCLSIFYWTYSRMNTPFTKLLKSIMWGGYIVVLYAFATGGITEIIMTVMKGGRLQSSFDNVNAVALLCAFSIILSVYFMIYKKNILLVIMDIPTLILLAACGSRKAMVILVLGCIAVYLFTSNVKNKTGILPKIFGACVLLSVILIAISSMELFGGINERMEGLIALITGQGEIDHSSMVRQQMSELGFSIFLEHPILGIGAGNAHIIDAKVLGEDCYLHNNYAEVLANGGLIGFILYYGQFYRVFLGTKKVGGLKTSEGRILLIMLASLLIADFGLVSYYSKIYYFFLLTFNMYFLEKRNIQISE